MVSNRLVVSIRQFALTAACFCCVALFVVSQQKAVYEQVDEALLRIRGLKEEHSNLTLKKAGILTEANRTQHLVEEHAKQLEVLDQFTRKNNLILHGVKEVEEEDTESLVLELFDQKFQIALDPKDIEFAERLNAEEKERRPIKIRFLRWKDRSRVFYKRKNLSKEMSLEEDLTAPQKDNKKKLEAYAKKVQEDGKRIKWSGGKLFVEGKQVDPKLL